MVIILLLLLLLFMFLPYYIRRRRVYKFQNHPTIPKRIWTYWNNDTLTPVVQKCIDSWKKYNPTYDITVIQPYNSRDYIDFDVKEIKFNDSPARESDIIRLHVLSKYGGIWCDASILMTRPFDIDVKDYHEFIGYYIEHFTVNQNSPCLENWFFATIPNGRFITAWRDAFMNISNFDTVEQWIQHIRDVKKIHIDGTVPPGLENYLACNLAAQEVLQSTPYISSCRLLAAELGPYNYWYKGGLKSVCSPNQRSMIKFTNHERKKLDTTPDLHCVFDDHSLSVFHFISYIEFWFDFFVPGKYDKK